MIAVFLFVILAASAVFVIIFAFYLGRKETVEPELFVNLFLTPILINDIVVMCAASIVGIIFTNRIAGPIYHMRHTIDVFLSGDSEKRVRLRPKDYAIPLADEINKLFDYAAEKSGKQ